MDASAVAALARRERAGGLISPGHRRPGARRGRGRGRARPAAPARPRDRGARHRQARAAPRVRSRGRAAPGLERGRRGPAAAPRASSSSRRRRRASAGSRSSSRAATSRAVVAAAQEASRDGRALCEEFVEGPELTVNAFVDGGRFVPLTVTDRERALAFGVATAHLYPSQHPVADVVAAARGRLPARSASRAGPTYTQVLLAPDGPRVMEVAARLGGGHDAELCAAALGVDLSAAAVRAALGARPGPLAPTRERAAVVRFLIAPAGPSRARRRAGRGARAARASSSPTPTARPAR